MKRKLLALFMAATMAVVMCACGGGSDDAAAEGAADASGEEASAEGGSEAKSAEDISIAVNLKTLNSEYWGNVKAGCDRAAEELGIEVTVNGPDAESEIAQQVTQIGDQLAQDVDAIIVAPCDIDSVSGALAPASGQIPIFFIDQDVDFEGKTSFI